MLPRIAGITGTAQEDLAGSCIHMGAQGELQGEGLRHNANAVESRAGTSGAAEGSP